MATIISQMDAPTAERAARLMEAHLGWVLDPTVVLRAIRLQEDNHQELVITEGRGDGVFAYTAHEVHAWFSNEGNLRACADARARGMNPYDEVFRKSGPLPVDSDTAIALYEQEGIKLDNPAS